jgi:hypothetical protein
MAMKGSSNYRMQANAPMNMSTGDQPTASAGDNSQSPQPIADNPQAMQCVDQLKQMGYTADDVAQAMGDEDQSQPSGDGGAMATKAAPMQIPSMG